MFKNSEKAFREYLFDFIKNRPEIDNIFKDEIKKLKKIMKAEYKEYLVSTFESTRSDLLKLIAIKGDYDVRHNRNEIEKRR